MVEFKNYHRGDLCIAGKKGMNHFDDTIIEEVLQ